LRRFPEALIVLMLAAPLAALPTYPQSAHAGEALDKALQMHCARAACTIRDNRGGDVDLYRRAAKEVLAEGKNLIIDGYCASACVVLMDLARSRTCITPDAEIAVHQTSIMEVPADAVIAGPDVPAGRLIRRADPPQSDDINRWVSARGGYPTEGVMIIPLNAARTFWPLCR
jgi:hypothetical protein